jgi:hypothetical protein
MSASLIPDSGDPCEGGDILALQQGADPSKLATGGNHMQSPGDNYNGALPQFFLFKLVAAVKYQYGFPGLTPPYKTRYLTMTVNLTKTLGNTVTSASQVFTYDRITGSSSPPTINQNALGYLPVFPYGQDLTGDPNTVYTVNGDTSYSYVSVSPFGYGTTNLSVVFSDQYTLEQLDADADTLIATVDQTTEPWNHLTEVFYEIFNPADDGIPEQYGYGGTTGGDVQALTSAAWGWLLLGGVSSVDWFPNTYEKLVSTIQTNGTYCQNTITFDYSNNIISTVCKSGVSIGNKPIIITPPPLMDGQNTVVTITPMCVCPKPVPV